MVFARMVTAVLLGCGLATSVFADDRLISRFFADHTAVMLLIDPAEGWILDGNRGAEAFYGVDLEELRNRRIQQINVYTDAEVAAMRAEVARGERAFFVFPHQTEHRGIRSVAVYSSPVQLPSGREALFSVIHDVSGHLIPGEDAEAYRRQLEGMLNETQQSLIQASERWVALQRWLLTGLAVLVLLLFWAYWNRSRMLQALARESFSARKLEVAVDHSPASIVIADRDGTIEYVNQTCVRNTGYSREELLGQNPRMLQSGRTAQETYVDLWTTITAGKTWEGRLVNRRKDGSDIVEWVLINPIVDEHEQPVRFIAVKEDITEREQLAERLRALERYDALTGLANRFAFFDQLKQNLHQLGESPKQQLLVVINIDRFHGFNELHGHELGDRLLQALARQVVKHVPPDALVARLGADELAILPLIESMSGSEEVGLEHLPWLPRLQRAMHSPLNVQNRSHGIRTSIGVACCDTRYWHEHGCLPGDFMRMADSALKSAKASGGGRIAFFDAEASEQTLQSLLLEQGLAQALERNQLSLALQAQVAIDGSLIGVEALLRWHHHDLGPVSPGLFIPLAEETGQIIPIGRWVLEQAVTLLARLQQHDPKLTVSVNISPIQMREPGFVSEVCSLLNRSPVHPGGLVLEITESVFLSDPERARVQLEALRALGVGISIDDFGTGYSSLSYLKRLPVTELKIDQSFVSGLPDDAADKALINIIDAAAQQFQLRVVAEGVETQKHADFFRDKPDIILQGYWFDKPSEIHSWMRKWCNNRG